MGISAVAIFRNVLSSFLLSAVAGIRRCSVTALSAACFVKLASRSRNQSLRFTSFFEQRFTGNTSTRLAGFMVVIIFNRNCKGFQWQSSGQTVTILFLFLYFSFRIFPRRSCLYDSFPVVLLNHEVQPPQYGRRIRRFLPSISGSPG